MANSLTTLGAGYTHCAQINLHHSVMASIACCQRIGDVGQRIDNTTTTKNNGHMTTDKPLIILAQEPYLQKGKVKVFSKDIKIFCSAENNNRSCIFTNKNIKGLLLNQYSDRDMTTISVQLDNKKILFCSLYCPFDSPQSPPTKLLIDLVKYVKDNNLKIVFSADANAHNEAWGSTNNNKRGEDLLNLS